MLVNLIAAAENYSKAVVDLPASTTIIKGGGNLIGASGGEGGSIARCASAINFFRVVAMGGGGY